VIRLHFDTQVNFDEFCQMNIFTQITEDLSVSFSISADSMFFIKNTKNRIMNAKNVV
jgi:hypothetical protein